MEKSNQHPLSIWSFVGFMLIIYGIIIFAMGIYYLYTPATTALNQLHPSLWWGACMFIAGLLFNWFDLRARVKT